MIKVTQSTITPSDIVAVSTRSGTEGITVQAGNGWDSQLWLDSSTRVQLTLDDAERLISALWDLGVSMPLQYMTQAQLQALSADCLEMAKNWQ